MTLLFASFFRIYLVSMILNSSAVYTLDICSNGYPRYIWEVFVILENALRYVFWRLIVIQIPVDCFIQFRMFNDCIGSDSIILLSDVAFMLSVSGVVSSSGPCLFG